MSAVHSTERERSFWSDCLTSASRPFARESSARNALIVSALTVAVKVAGAAKIAISARVLGPGDELDSYLVAFLVPSILCDVLAGSLAPALIPELANGTEPKAEGMAANRAFFLVCIGVFGIAMVIAASISGWVLPGIAHGFSPSKLELTHRLLILMVPMIPLSGLSAMWRAVLNHKGRFLLSTGSAIMTPLLASVFLLSGRGINALALGTVLGSLTEALLLGAGLVSTGASILPQIQRGFGFHRWLSIGYVPLLLASALGAGSNVIDQTIAAGLGPGSVSVLNLGTRLVTVLLAIGPASVATVLMPKFSKLIADANWVKLRHLASVSTLAGMLLMIPPTLVGFWFAKPLAEFAFFKGSGRPEPIGLIAAVQAFSFLQLPFVMGSVILSRLLVSLREARRLLLLTGSALILKVVLGLSLAKVMGVAGLSLSMSCVQLVVFLMTLRLALQAEMQISQSDSSCLVDFTGSLQGVGMERMTKRLL
jgi:putative peptidoglycan lipid II flippase